MMHTLRALAFAAALTPLAALGQSAPANLPAQTVYGRLGIPGDTGPGQAIPMARLNIFLLASLCQTNNAMPVYSTSQGKWICTPTQTANTVLAGPGTGAAAQGAYRALVGADLPLPAALTLGGAFSKAAVASNWLRSLGTDGNFTVSQPAFSDLTGAATGAQLPNPSASTLGGVQSKTAVTHQFLNTISNAGVPGSAQPACTDLSDATSCNAARGQLPGETSTGAASAGNVGEYIESVIVSGSAISTVTGTAKTVTSIPLTAGDWDVSGNISFITATSTSVTGVSASISGTTNVNDLTPGKFSGLFFGATVPGAATPALAIPIGPYRLSLSGNTTVFLIQTSFYSASTLTAYGIIRARRVR